MKVETLLGLPEALEIVSDDVSEKGITLIVISTQANPCCPLCGTSASRVHSHYSRQLSDAPCAGRLVHLILHVRKFFCDEPTCARKIFVERLAPFAQPWARVTARLCQMAEAVGLATGGRLGERLTDRLGMPTCWMTLLRRIMGLSTLPVEQVSHLGLDDFSFRRGRRFGTILVDLQSHQVIDLLPDRAIETVAAWLSAHPEIRLISRDRGGDYAAAARKSAPQAIQTADRFHISKNLTEAVELALARCRTEIRNHAEITARREVSEAAQQALGESRKTFALKTWKPSPDPSAERARLTRRTQRYDRYQQVVALHAQGFQQTEIADRVGLTTRTIQTWLKAGTFPEAKQRRKQQSQFDPYAAYVLKRWEEGCKNGSQLYREMKEKGYTGTERQVHRFLLPLRSQLPLVQTVEAPQTPVQDFSANKSVWLFVRQPDDLDETEQATLAAICQASETARTIYQLVQEFRQILHTRLGEKLDGWLEKVRASQIPELQSFVVGVERDKAAVVAGLTLPHNNGMVEGKVNKLKLIKRMGYGRAEFPLLRQRVLHAL